MTPSVIKCHLLCATEFRGPSHCFQPSPNQKFAASPLPFALAAWTRVKAASSGLCPAPTRLLCQALAFCPQSDVLEGASPDVYLPDKKPYRTDNT